MLDSYNSRTGNIIICKDCGQEFVFTVHQKEAFDSRGWDAPKRCPLCRKWKRFVNQNRQEVQ